MKHRQATDVYALRHEIDRHIANGEAQAARVLLEKVWADNPGPGLASFIVSRFERLSHQLTPSRCRLALLRSFTVEPAIALLKANAFVHQIEVETYVAKFNAYTQEILDSSSGLYQFSPDVAILMAQTLDVAPELIDGFADLSAPDLAATAERVVDHFENIIKTFRAHSQASLIVHSLEMPLNPVHGAFDAQSETGQVEAVRRINRELARICRQHIGVYLLEYDDLIARHGRINWYDAGKWLTMRMPIAADCLIYLAQEWTRFIQPLTGKICKALVTDLDNTLWGGVIGEDGVQGIRLGNDYPGAGYRALQRTMLDLYRRGIILAVCSKNNLVDAMEAIEHHPDMLLRPNHFAALRINWQDKAQNLREIASELNIGIDTIAFLDDNPVERQWVRSQLPEVKVIELPEDSLGYAQAVRNRPEFERLALSDEDRERGRYYAEQRLRTELEQKAVSLEDFYESLQQEVEIALVTTPILNRVAQLTQKTNQFNLTTRRYNEQQIAAMVKDSDWGVYSIRVRDRFGDNGLVGVAITHKQGVDWELDTFLMSCRVILRTVETALLAFLVEKARAAGARQLFGWFISTKQNAPAKDFYPSHGLTCTEQLNGKSCWRLDLSGANIEWPRWIKRVGAQIEVNS